MRKGKFWLRVFNVRTEEWPLVKRLFILQFLQGAGIAFFFTTSFIQFLEKYPITELPWVMVISSGLLWICGWLYNHFEHKLHSKTLSVAVTIFMGVSVLLLASANYFLAHSWIFYLMLAWFNVLYLLNNLEFWGLASQLFDIRQSKRLFGVISGGDIPAKLLGYSTAALLIDYAHIDARAFSFVAAAFIFASLALIPFVSKDIQTHHHKEKHVPKKSAPFSIKGLVQKFAFNSLIRRIAFLALITSISIIIINYGFYAEVKSRNIGQVGGHLASFVLFFLVIMRTVSVIIKMILTSRLLASWGIRLALFVTPAIMIAMVLFILSIEWYSNNQNLIFYSFAALAIAIDALRTAINSPVLLTAMQPLSTLERLKAHNIVKGIMDPFAYLFSGLLLLSISSIKQIENILSISWALLILGLLWMVGIFLVNQEYLKTLIKAISSRFFSQEEFSLSDERTLELIRNKIETGTEQEIIHVLRMLDSQNAAVADDLIIQLLQSDSDRVKSEAMLLVADRKIEKAIPTLNIIIDASKNEEIIRQAITSLCRIAIDRNEIVGYSNHVDPQIQQAALIGMLNNNDASIKNEAAGILRGLIQSSSIINRKQALNILSVVKDQHGELELLKLLTENDEEISEKCLEAIGKATPKPVLEELLKQINKKEKRVFKAFQKAGDTAVPVLETKVYDPSLSVELQSKLIHTIGKIGGFDAHAALLRILKKEPIFLCDCIKALNRCHYTVSPDTRKSFEDIARSYIVYGTELLHMEKLLSNNKNSHNLLFNSIQMELVEIRELLLDLFGFLYDRERINKVRFGLNIRKKETVANALEVIETMVKKDIAVPFNNLYEQTSVEQRCDALRSLFLKKEFEKVEHIILNILSEKPINYHYWTKACSLYLTRKQNHPIEIEILEKYRQSPNQFLKETAEYAINN